VQQLSGLCKSSTIGSLRNVHARHAPGKNNNIWEYTVADLTVRRLLIDLDSPVPRHWVDGDPFRTAFFSALSFGFPVGEDFFIRSVKRAIPLLPEKERPLWQKELQGFIGQEATHRRIHSLFNDKLAANGLVDSWSPRAASRMHRIEAVEPSHALAATAATEHFTAILANYLFDYPEQLGNSEERFKTLWFWHAAEESEHRASVFDLYCALGGTHERRVWWMKRITYVFLSEALRQTISNLHHDGNLWKWKTWKVGIPYLFGKKGLFRTIYGPWKDYFSPNFHPGQHNADKGIQWLQANQAQFTVVGTAPVTPAADVAPAPAPVVAASAVSAA
jgi:predicted metal-dependent hydrolase